MKKKAPAELAFMWIISTIRGLGALAEFGNASGYELLYGADTYVEEVEMVLVVDDVDVPAYLELIGATPEKLVPTDKVAAGHVQYTRNTVTGMSTSQAVVLLIDARHGVVEQTRRHLNVAALLGARPRYRL